MSLTIWNYVRLCYLLYISYLTNKCQITYLDITEHLQLYLVKNHINKKKRYSIVYLQIVSETKYHILRVVGRGHFPTKCFNFFPCFVACHSGVISTFVETQLNPTLGGCTVYYVWEPRAFMSPPKNP